MMDDQTQFLVLMGVCFVAGLFLSLTNKDRKDENQNFNEKKMKIHPAVKEGIRNMIHRK
jgi:hypothetical protein